MLIEVSAALISKMMQIDDVSMQVNFNWYAGEKYETVRRSTCL